MNKQLVFDEVSTHLLRQMTKSETTGTCKYRGPDGRKCAMGCLIPDELYDSKMEGLRFGYLLAKNSSRFLLKYLMETYGDLNIKFLSELQFIHDYYPPDKWKDQLSLFAKDHGMMEKYL